MRYREDGGWYHPLGHFLACFLTPTDTFFFARHQCFRKLMERGEVFTIDAVPVVIVTRRSIGKDLFGNPVRQRRPQYEAALERADKVTLPARAARVRWLSQIIPRNVSFGMPLETAYVFEESKSSFVYGNFAAAIVLAASFVEHWFAASLRGRGYEREASQGLAVSVEAARANNLVNSMLLDKVDKLRLIRNPFVHLKSFDHAHTMGRRLAKHKTHPEALLETDAKEALIAMYGVAVHAFSGK